MYYFVIFPFFVIFPSQQWYILKALTGTFTSYSLNFLLELFHSKESVIEIKVKTKNLRKSIEISTRCFFDQICIELLAKEKSARIHQRNSHMIATRFLENK